jgi:type IV pilus assembly protein PilV
MRKNKSEKVISVKQIGASFIELLVALVILAIGLLGVLSMQATGLTSNQRALFATEVNLLVSDMADRILAHGIAGADAGEYDGLSTDGNVVLTDAVANADRLAWSIALNGDVNDVNNNGSSLPAPIGDVSWDSDTRVYTISIRWDDARQGVVSGTVAEDCGNYVDDPDLDAAANAAAELAATAAAADLINGVGNSLSCYQFHVSL